MKIFFAALAVLYSLGLVFFIKDERPRGRELLYYMMWPVVLTTYSIQFIYNTLRAVGGNREN